MTEDEKLRFILIVSAIVAGYARGPVAKFVSRPRNRRIGAVFGLASPRKGSTSPSYLHGHFQTLRHVWTPLEEQEKSLGAVWPVVGC